ncbi:MAG: serine hydrolase domain-containing protein [Dehalococcoidia bacterium]|jgi:CubicO group peptidase (beta-lactamase class C family)
MLFNKTKRINIISIIVFIVVVAGLFLTGLNCSNPPSNNLALNLERSVSGLVEKDKSIKSCVLAVMKGDGSYSWIGAAGIANPDGQVPMTKDTPIYIASVTKLYTAAAIMKLYEVGALSLDDPMSKYLPADLIRGIHIYKGKDYSNEITIKQLLSHTSGIADYYTEKSKKDGKSLFELFLEEPEKSWTVDETIARARDDLEPHFPPGTDAYYSDTNFQLLGKIIENVSQKPLQIVYEDFFFHPLNLQNTWLTGLSEPQVAPSAAIADVFYKDKAITRIRSRGAYWADGGIVSTAGDMIIFLKALNEGKIINRDTLELMHDWHKLEFPIQYGYGTMYFQLPALISKWTGLTPLWGHSGTTGSFLYYSEDLNLYMAGSINNADSNIKPFMLMRDVMNLVRQE